MQAYESSGSFDNKGQLHLDTSLPIRSHKVRVIVIVEDKNELETEHSLTNIQLTQMNMKLSETSLNDVWAGKDDDYWNSYLKS